MVTKSIKNLVLKQVVGEISGDEFVLNKYVENMSECHCNILETMSQRVFSNGWWNIFLEICFFKSIMNICYRNMFSCRMIFHVSHVSYMFHMCFTFRIL